MKEEFLHYLWKHRLYDACNLLDNSGNRIEVFHPGDYNRDSGPDFFNARISTGGITWAGNIEIHLKASHFISHGHNTDPAYNNIILHVVAENDRAVLNSRGEQLPTAVLNFDPLLYDNYLRLVGNPTAVACHDSIGNIDELIFRSWITALGIERLQSKTEHILGVYRQTGCDWDETLYRIIARYFGFRVNTEPFEMLASAIPFRIIRRHADDRMRIEALMYGTAGMLDKGIFREAVNDDYFISLVREYSVLQAKYSLRPLHGWIWKFSKLRPANFPTVRISQLASMLVVTGGLFSRITEASCISEISELISAGASDYWTDHYVFGKKSKSRSGRPGTQAVDLLLINALIPVMFVYGSERKRDDICERAVGFLESVEAERNSVITDWNKSGVKPANAFESQALLELRNSYCRKRRCLECRIGNIIIASGRQLTNHTDLILEPPGEHL